MAEDTILMARSGSVLTVTLNRPHAKNAMNFAMVDALIEAFEAASDDDSVRVLVLKGSDGVFCAGGDLKDMGSSGQKPSDVAAGNRRFGQLLEVAQAFPKILVTVCEKAAMGGGFGLVCVSDIAIAESGCRFGMPEVTLGILPAQIAPFVLARIGLTETRRLALTGHILDGDSAKDLGIVHYNELGTAAVEARLDIVLKQCLKAAPGAVKATKKLLMASAQSVTSETLDTAARMFAGNLLGDEGLEGTRAFREKRPPVWTEGRT